MNSVSSWQNALVVSWSKVWGSFLNILPTILGAILIFAIGLILAYWIKRLMLELFRLLKLDKVSESLGIDSFLTKAEVKLKLSSLLASVAEWLVVLVFFLAAVEILGLTMVSTVLVKVISYVPNILAAALIFGAGHFVAGLVEGMVRGAFASVDHEASKPVGKAARWLIILIAFFAAIDQLQIAQGLINTFFQGLTYTIVLVVGLSVGLGAKDLVSKVLNDWYDNIKK